MRSLLLLAVVVLVIAVTCQALPAESEKEATHDETAVAEEEDAGAREARQSGGRLDAFLDGLDDRLINIASDLLNLARTIQELQGGSSGANRGKQVRAPLV